MFSFSLLFFSLLHYVLNWRISFPSSVILKDHYKANRLGKKGIKRNFHMKSVKASWYSWPLPFVSPSQHWLSILGKQGNLVSPSSSSGSPSSSSVILRFTNDLKGLLRVSVCKLDTSSFTVMIFRGFVAKLCVWFFLTRPEEKLIFFFHLRGGTTRWIVYAVRLELLLSCDWVISWG